MSEMEPVPHVGEDVEMKWTWERHSKHDIAELRWEMTGDNVASTLKNKI